ncbi:hypothetical protein S40293_10634 [Stachybotrys chartarum IBT 40293]|nr:hypothetical protein S40293_10634 [Stachybotrys chartarum IBT 40293]KFA72329.1 hypothetical protein S40288_10719 [Stachybotrys chartarum IBT 40288]
MRQRNEKEQLTLHGSLVDSVEIEHVEHVEHVPYQGDNEWDRHDGRTSLPRTQSCCLGRIGPDGQRAAAPTDREAAGLHVPARGQVVSPHGDVEMHARSR